MSAIVSGRPHYERKSHHRRHISPPPQPIDGFDDLESARPHRGRGSHHRRRSHKSPPPPPLFGEPRRLPANLKYKTVLCQRCKSEFRHNAKGFRTSSPQSHDSSSPSSTQRVDELNKTPVGSTPPPPPPLHQISFSLLAMRLKFRPPSSAPKNTDSKSV
ncbi:hypothetical protein LguiA_024508 [Lonicera macranthoides]